jgi:Bacterial Ig-like domain (group 3)
MPLDHDAKLGGPTYAGPPPDRSSDDLPRWGFILVVAISLTLLLALLRYAIDLLGVVFLIMLVGFSIRTVGDWLTESESVSAWAVSAVSTGLIGTMLVGLWVFSSPEFSGTAITERLPAPVAGGMQWLEARGWGQRVLLSRPPVLNSNADAMASRAPSGLTPPPASSGGGRSVSTPASEAVSEPVQPHPPTVRMPPRSRRGPSEAEAASLEAGASATSKVSAPAVDTTVVVKSWPVPAVVGKSVRLTAIVAADGSTSPSGMVTFYSDGTRLGSVPVYAIEPGRGEAALVTLSLPLGAHEITARFTGASGFSSSQALPLRLTVGR